MCVFIHLEQNLEMTLASDLIIFDRLYIFPA